MLRYDFEKKYSKLKAEAYGNDYGYVETPQIQENDLCEYISWVSGVLLPRAHQFDRKYSGKMQDSCLVLTQTTAGNMHQIALTIAMGKPILLSGENGSGKTALIEDIARRTCHLSDLIRINIGDQTDSKLLLGTYIATDEPGIFHWQPGILTVAVKEGLWIVVEDIDLAPPEVISVLLPLLESRELFIASRGERLKAEHGFQLFATKARESDGSTIRESLWTRVQVNPLSDEELELVVKARFPALEPFSQWVMKVFNVAKNSRDFVLEKSPGQIRHLNSRDLLKWCRRVSVTAKDELNPVLRSLNEQAREIMFQEAYHTYCGSFPDPEAIVQVLQDISHVLGLSRERAVWYAESYVPKLEILSNTVRIGYSIFDLHQKVSITRGNAEKRPFARTRHALRLLDRIASSVKACEPLLLIGETGTGKTTVIQHLAEYLGRRLTVFNLSQQSDTTDLLGGYKPVDVRFAALPLKEKFDDLFARTFSAKKNTKYIEAVRKAFAKKSWKRFSELLKEACKMAMQRLTKIEEESPQNVDGEAPKPKRQKTSHDSLLEEWKLFSEESKNFEVKQMQMQGKIVFSFVEGSLVKAVKNGDWILLDEVNLASTETLECLSGLLQDASGSILLMEKGDREPLKRHESFRVFACMNPATDVGKKDLPMGLRSRFTEFYVQSPDSNVEDLLEIVKSYLVHSMAGDLQICSDIAEFYIQAKRLSSLHLLADGANQRPHYSLRTLSRALVYANDFASVYGLRRSMYEGIQMTFMTQLDFKSAATMQQLLKQHLLKDIKDLKHFSSRIPKQPSENHCQFGPFWLKNGPLNSVIDEQYIITPSVEQNLSYLARAIMSNRYPVLIQGPTSAGKTSMIEYLAKRTGHQFIRINNHEHTDLQEYLGTYISRDRQLVFQEGALVEALRNGYWIVLDELNLAPTEVLEALNRLLDDNRELLIPETQETVRPHPHFMLFATQNPAGLYGGRKELSRAFRNRFLELHFNEIPKTELDTILSQRCKIAPSYAKKLVQVYNELQEKRSETQIFAGRDGFITLRDLFRWANRAAVGYQELAEHGYMLLAERSRQDKEKELVKGIIESVMKVKIEPESIYNCGFERFKMPSQSAEVSWTKAMKRLFTLVMSSLESNEPVLLVGETGCGKTTVCELIAKAQPKALWSVNCHQNTETSDIIGGQRPIRSKTELRTSLFDDLKAYLQKSSQSIAFEEQDLEDLIAILDSSHKGEEAEELQQKIGKYKALFDWHDGPLITAMKTGSFFLLDEISLADDSVLERLNSVLEPERLIVLAEKGGQSIEKLTAAEGFQFCATMNPGGDYGKKELSPALRNRLTEIWVPSVNDAQDLHEIVANRLSSVEKGENVASTIIAFVGWLSEQVANNHMIYSLRDLISWAEFVARTYRKVGLASSFINGGQMIFLDGLENSGSFAAHFSNSHIGRLRQSSIEILFSLSVDLGDDSSVENTGFGVDPFYIPFGPSSVSHIKFSLDAPTTKENLRRIIRAMQVKKPILMEGSPGVGKTSLIVNLAAVSGHPLTRVNLSEHTDLSDLFGSDLPIEGGKGGEFAWRDAPFLQAMQTGDWVILDEINLAPQSVLEGLNACLDHRASVYIPELDRTFSCNSNFKIFATQNPLSQGGGRKGLPKSFLNRFTQVYIKPLQTEDLQFICCNMFPQIPPEEIQQTITFNQLVHQATMVDMEFGRNGAPWEFNLRDLIRWFELKLSSTNVFTSMSDADAFEMLYNYRMRTLVDRQCVTELYSRFFKGSCHKIPMLSLSPQSLSIGNCILERKDDSFSLSDSILLRSSYGPLEMLVKCVEMNWMPILVGPAFSGKTSLVRTLAHLTGNDLVEFSMNAAVDTMELLGAFEQQEVSRYREDVTRSIEKAVRKASQHIVASYSAPAKSIKILHQLHCKFEALKAKNDASNFIACSREILDLLKSLDVLTAINSISNLIEKYEVILRQSTQGKFEWIDGVLVNCLERGQWILIENANLCNPSILDRLNSLLEPGGELLLNERGSLNGEKVVVRPHPHFRIFLTLDPKYGELSRAMRNRGVEISLVDSGWTHDVKDFQAVMHSHGITNYNTEDMESCQLNLQDFLSEKIFCREEMDRGMYCSDRSMGRNGWSQLMRLNNLSQFSHSANAILVFDAVANNRNLDTKTCVKFIVKSLNTENARTSMLWNAYQKHPIWETIFKEINFPIIIETLAAKEKLVSQMKIPADYVSFLGSQIYWNEQGSLSPKVKSLVEDYENCLETLEIRLELEEIMQTLQLKLTNSKSFLQDSFAFHEGRIPITRLKYPVISLFYPFLREMLRLCDLELSSRKVIKLN